jgi:squalene-hopene/tetraprenyl-beta-curcumene cyclase
LPDGSWEKHPAITALAVTSFLRSGAKLTGEQQATVERAMKFILTNVKTNGAIYGANDFDKYPNYSTAICLVALAEARNPAYDSAVSKARDFLLGSQFDESEDITVTNASYGGIGYGRRGRPDLSNTQWALEALHVVKQIAKEKDQPQPPGWELHWEKAVQFVQRCQNLPASNDQPWAKNTTDRDKGGFVYMPGFSFAEDEPPKSDSAPLRSQASMSYAGLKSYLYADLKKDDPRVVAVVNWLQRNYTLEENPGVGQQGLYYYFHTVAKALSAYGEDIFVDAAGKRHDWRAEMMTKLLSLQRLPDGCWFNDNNRWMENDPILVTSYSLLALETLKGNPQK